MKVKALGAVLAKRFGVEAARELVPSHPTLGDVDSAQALEDYQAAKRSTRPSGQGEGARLAQPPRGGDEFLAVPGLRCDRSVNKEPSTAKRIRQRDY